MECLRKSMHKEYTWNQMIIGISTSIAYYHILFSFVLRHLPAATFLFFLTICTLLLLNKHIFPLIECKNIKVNVSWYVDNIKAHSKLICSEMETIIVYTQCDDICQLLITLFVFGSKASTNRPLKSTEVCLWDISEVLSS